MTDEHWKRQALSVTLCLVLILATMGSGADAAMLFQDQRAAPASAPSSGYPGQGAPETAEELQGLVAPIALYPDALVAQILSAATFPDQVAVANYWLQQNKRSYGHGAGAGGEQTDVGPQRQGAHAVSFGDEQYGAEPCRGPHNWERPITTSSPMS